MMERQMSLNTPIKILQQNLWQIKKSSAQMQAQNNKLKGKLNSQMKWRKRRCQSNFGHQPQESNELAMKLTEMKERNRNLKQRINYQEDELKCMESSMHEYPKLIKRKVRLQKCLKKYSRRIQLIQQSSKDINQEYVVQEKGRIKQKFIQAQSQIEELKNEALRSVQQLKVLRRENRRVNEEVIGLINLKNELKKNLKQIKSKK